MMDQKNMILWKGRLGADPELSYTPKTSTAICTFPVLVDRPKRNGQDNGHDSMTIKVIASPRTDGKKNRAERTNEILSKGDAVDVLGKIETRSYQDQTSGKWVKVVEIVAENVEFVYVKKWQNGQSASNYGDAAAPAQQTPPPQYTPSPAPQPAQIGFSEMAGDEEELF